MIQRRRRAEPSVAAVVIRGGLVIAVALALLFIALTAGRGVPGVPHYVLRAQFENLQSVRSNAEVRIAGVRVGQVIDPRREDGRATVDLQLDSGTAPLPVDSRVRVRSVSLLGAKYLEIIPGRARETLPEGAVIPSEQTSRRVDVAEFLDAFDAPARNGLQATIRSFGEGFLGRGIQLNDALRDAPALLTGTASLAREINRRDGAAARFAPSLLAAASAADPVRREIASGFDPAARALAPMAERRSDLEAALAQAPPTLTRVSADLRRTDPLLVEAQGLLRAAEDAMRVAPEPLTETRRLLREARRPLAATRPFLREAARSAAPVSRLLRSLDPEIGRLSSVFENSVEPLRAVGRHKCDVIQFAQNWRSMLGFGTPGGGGGEIGGLSVLRLELLGSAETAGGVLGVRPEGTIRSDPYPQPCTVGEEP